MAKSILTTPQKNFLDFFKLTPALHKRFYFTGGTALSEYHLHHRLSEDLDFFSSQEFDNTNITPIIKLSQAQLHFKNFEFQQSFNRNLFFLHFEKNDQLKLEFTYFPFPQIDETNHQNNLRIDSVLDIAVNKLFTIYQKPRGRDFFDLYLIFKQKKWTLKKLIQLARNKFDTVIDPIQLGKQLQKSAQLRDDPIMTATKLNLKTVTTFFHDQAKMLGKDIFE